MREREREKANTVFVMVMASERFYEDEIRNDARNCRWS
jgi:hypothetical protein